MQNSIDGVTNMLKTEMRNEKTKHIDQMGTADMLRLMSEENMNAVRAVDECIDEIGQAVMPSVLPSPRGDDFSTWGREHREDLGLSMPLNVPLRLALITIR